MILQGAFKWKQGFLCGVKATKANMIIFERMEMKE